MTQNVVDDLVSWRKNIELVSFCEGTEKDGMLPKGIHSETKQLSNGVKAVTPYDLAVAFLGLNKVILTGSDNYPTLMMYHPDLGYYSNIDLNFSRYLRRGIPEYLQKCCSNKKDAEVQSIIKGMLNVEQDFHATEGIVNFANGVYDARDNTWNRHSEAYCLKSVIKLDCNLNNIGKYPTPVFDKFLGDITEECVEAQIFLAELMGYLISTIRQKNIFMLYGPSNTGKSVFIEFLREMLGKEFTTAIPIDRLAGEFRGSELSGSMMNAYAEIDDIRKKDITMLKALSSGDMRSYNVKFCRPIEFRNEAALVFGTNSIDNFEGLNYRDAFWQRLVLMPFNHVVRQKDMDYSLPQKLRNEMVGIVHNYALPGLRSFVRNGMQFSNMDFLEEIKEKQFDLVDSVENFVKNTCDIGLDAVTPSAELYYSYREYCRDKDMPVLGRDHFRERLFSLYPFLEYTRVQMKNRYRRVFRGISLKENPEDKKGGLTS